MYIRQLVAELDQRPRRSKERYKQYNVQRIHLMILLTKSKMRRPMDHRLFIIAENGSIVCQKSQGEAQRPVKNGRPIFLSPS
jgi:hypothetical protein